MQLIIIFVMYNLTDNIFMAKKSRAVTLHVIEKY